MRFIEKENSFIEIERDEEIPKGTKVYSLSFPVSYFYEPVSRMSIPQYELEFVSYGDYPYTNSLKLNYRGISVHPGFREKEKDILDLLNDLKKGDYQIKMKVYFKEYYKEEKHFYETIEGVLVNNNSKLEREIIKLKNEIKERQDSIIFLESKFT